ncbi:MAG TPA: hypothetical protein VFQ61_24635 [Polyangiaceae bacterium]|nr:hypothetical protein [Polyangiaceae bacterium]
MMRTAIALFFLVCGLPATAAAQPAPQPLPQPPRPQQPSSAVGQPALPAVPPGLDPKFRPDPGILLLLAPVPTGAQKAAGEGLATLRELVTAQNCVGLGFDKPEDVQRAKLGVPIRDLSVSLERLKQYEANTSIAALVLPFEKFTVPVLVDGAVRSSISVVRRGPEWHAASFGFPNLIRGISGVVAAQAGNAQARGISIVRVPSLRLLLVAHVTNGRLFFTEVTGGRRLRLDPGTTQPADSLLFSLRGPARAYRPLRPRPDR